MTSEQHDLLTPHDMRPRARLHVAIRGRSSQHSVLSYFAIVRA